MDSHYFAGKICPIVETAVKKARRIRACFFHACAWKCPWLAEGGAQPTASSGFEQTCTNLTNDTVSVHQQPATDLHGRGVHQHLRRIQNEKQLSSHRKYDKEIIGASEARLPQLRRSRGSHSCRCRFACRFGGWSRAPECPKQQIADCCGES